MTTTSETKTPEQYAEIIKVCIIEDVLGGLVPPTVTSFSELHDHVDANEYLIDARVPWDLDPETGETDLGPTNATTDIVDAWLQQGGIAQDMPTRRETINRTRLAHEGATYARQWVGVTVRFTDSEGRAYLGQIDGFGFSDSQRSLAGYPIIKCADGRWFRGDFTLQVAR